MVKVPEINADHERRILGYFAAAMGDSVESLVSKLTEPFLEEADNAFTIRIQTLLTIAKQRYLHEESNVEIPSLSREEREALAELCGSITSMIDGYENPFMLSQNDSRVFAESAIDSYLPDGTLAKTITAFRKSIQDTLSVR